MKDEIKSELNAIFQKHNANKRAAAAKQTKESKEVAFLKQFLDVRESVIRPAMQAIGEFIKGQGYDYEITTEEDGFRTEGPSHPLGLIPASICLHIMVGPNSRSDANPSFKAICDKNAQVVSFHENTITPRRSGRASGAGTALLSEIDQELVQKKILEVIREVFS